MQTKRGLFWIASYPRSGNTWVRVFIHNLFDEMNGTPSENGLANLTRYCASERAMTYFRPFLKGEPAKNDWQSVAAVRPKVHAHIADKATGSIFVKTHLSFTKMGSWPTINTDVTLGAIYLVRNPLDVACSLAPHYGISIDDAIAHMETFNWSELNSPSLAHQVVGSWSQNVQGWATRPRFPVTVVRYEDMVADPANAFRGMTAAAGLHPSEAQFTRALQRSAFSALRRSEEAAGFAERPVFSSDRFFRAGRADQWRDLLSEGQVERIVRAHGEQMRRFGYPLEA